MVIRSKTLKKYIRISLAGFMSVWLSGFVFLLFCHIQSDAAEFCPLAKPGVHCDKAEKAKDAEKFTKQTSDAGMDCCAFIPLFFDKTRTVDNQRQVVFATPSYVAITPRFAASYTLATNTPRLHISTVLPRNDTFLKNRTFRI